MTTTKDSFQRDNYPVNIIPAILANAQVQKTVKVAYIHTIIHQRYSKEDWFGLVWFGFMTYQLL